MPSAVIGALDSPSWLEGVVAFDDVTKRRAFPVGRDPARIAVAPGVGSTTPVTTDHEAREQRAALTIALELAQGADLSDRDLAGQVPHLLLGAIRSVALPGERRPTSGVGLGRVLGAGVRRADDRPRRRGAGEQDRVDDELDELAHLDRVEDGIRILHVSEPALDDLVEGVLRLDLEVARDQPGPGIGIGVEHE